MISRQKIKDLSSTLSGAIRLVCRPLILVPAAWICRGVAGRR